MSINKKRKEDRSCPELGSVLSLSSFPSVCRDVLLWYAKTNEIRVRQKYVFTLFLSLNDGIEKTQ